MVYYNIYFAYYGYKIFMFSFWNGFKKQYNT